MNQLTQEELKKINSDIQAVLDKYGVTLQPTMVITYVPVAPKEQVVKETEVISPISDEYNKEN